MPIWACLLAWPILGERINLTRMIALILCAAGIVVLISPLAGAGIPPSLLFAVAAGVSWAAGTVYLKWAKIEGDPVAIAGWQLATSVVVLLAATADLRRPPAPVAHAMANHSGARLLPEWSDRDCATSCGSRSCGGCRPPWLRSAYLCSPVIGIIASAIVLGERPTIHDYIGCALIFAAAACVLIVPAERKAAPVEADGAMTPAAGL